MNRQLSLRLLLGAAALVAAACGPQQSATALAPAEITPATACILDGMLLADFPGPKGQIHYENQKDPEFFCDTVEVFATLLRPEQARRVAAVYVQDMGATDWEAPKGHWIDAKKAYFVHGSKRKGSMGPTLGSFAQIEAAQKFAAEHGGKVLKFDEITAGMVALDGGALHDQKM